MGFLLTLPLADTYVALCMFLWEIISGDNEPVSLAKTTQFLTVLILSAQFMPIVLLYPMLSFPTQASKSP